MQRQRVATQKTWPFSNSPEGTVNLTKNVFFHSAMYIGNSIICDVCSERAAGDVCSQNFFFLYVKFNYPRTSVCRYVNLILYHKQTVKVFISDLLYVLQYGSCYYIPYRFPTNTGIC